MLQDFELQARRPSPFPRRRSSVLVAPRRPTPARSHGAPTRRRNPACASSSLRPRAPHAPQDKGLRVLACVIISYNFFFLVIGTFVFHGFMAAYGPFQVLTDHNIDPLWFSAFSTVSSFNNVGLSLLDDNFTQLYNRGAVLVLMSFMIICGARFSRAWPPARRHTSDAGEEPVKKCQCGVGAGRVLHERRRP